MIIQADAHARASTSNEQPTRLDLPNPGVGQRARRLARTVSVTGRHLAPVIVRSVVRAQKEQRPLATGVRRAFEGLGATYIKFGQFVASAPAIFGAGTSEEFRGCLDRCPAINEVAVRALIEDELGRPLDEMFCEFNAHPLAAASLAVVHRARLIDGRPVVVKVIRPGVARTVAADLALMLPLSRFLARQGSESAMNVLNYLVGLRDQIREELDLRNEARAMKRFQLLFHELGLSLLLVPEVYEELSGRRVLTMECLEGTPIDDLTAIERSGHDPRPVVRQLLEAWILTGLYEATFHGDIHAGNLLLLQDGRLGMLDWGIVARLDPQMRRLFRRLLEASIGREEAWDEITAHVIQLQGRALRDGFGMTDEQIGTLVRSLMEPVLTTPIGDVSMAALFGSTDEMVVRATGSPSRTPTLRQRLASYRSTRRAMRVAIEDGVAEAEFRRTNFLAAKQLVYLERYWKMYLPDAPILGDRAFIERALAQSAVASDEGASTPGGTPTP